MLIPVRKRSCKPFKSGKKIEDVSLKDKVLMDGLSQIKGKPVYGIIVSKGTEFESVVEIQRLVPTVHCKESIPTDCDSWRVTHEKQIMEELTETQYRTLMLDRANWKEM